jgi:ATP-binding cassette subfamily F protein 2
MSSSWHEKKAKAADLAFESDLQNAPDASESVKDQTSDAAMGGGDDELFDKKLSKDEKKALAKKKREAKKAAKNKGKNGDDADDDDGMDDVAAKMKALNNGGDREDGANKRSHDDGIDHEASDKLAAEGTFVTYSANRKGVDARARDINVENVTLQHMGAILLDDTNVVLNHGNRYGLVGRNGCGKVSGRREYSYLILCHSK